MFKADCELFTVFKTGALLDVRVNSVGSLQELEIHFFGALEE